MSFALFLLASHPDVQNQALEEQKSIFADDILRPATYDDLQNMKYLECVIKETLRLYPSVPFFARKTHKEVEFKGINYYNRFPQVEWSIKNIHLAFHLYPNFIIMPCSRFRI
nr:unnamed protein product [Callosobruchus analis]